MDAIVMANPTEFCSANTAPTRFDGAAAADKAENCGESATTAAPQTSNSARNTFGESCLQPTATTKQQNPETASDTAATRPLPTLRLMKPPTMHPNAPIAMIANASPGTLHSWLRDPKAALRINGTSVQNV